MFKTIIIDGERKQVFKSKIGTYGCYTYYIDEDGDFMTTQKCRKDSHCYRNHEAEDFMYNRKIIRIRRFKNKA